MGYGYEEGCEHEFIPLEGQGAVSIDRVMCIVRVGDETAIHLRNGAVMVTGFKPETLARRYNSLMSEARRNAGIAALSQFPGDAPGQGGIRR